MVKEMNTRAAFEYIDRQSSNLGLGMFSVWIVCLAAFFISGEFPVRGHAVAAIAAMYVLYIAECKSCKGWRSFEGFLFSVVYGAGGTIAAFREFDVGNSLVVFDMIGPLPIFSAFIVHFILGILWRLWGQS